MRHPSLETLGASWPVGYPAGKTQEKERVHHRGRRGRGEFWDEGLLEGGKGLQFAGGDFAGEWSVAEGSALLLSRG